MRKEQRTLLLSVLTATLLLVTAFSSAAARQAPDTSAVGIWQGALDVGGSNLRIVFHVVKAAGNSLGGALDSPDQGAMGIPVSKVRVSNDSVLFEVAAVGGAYEGRMSGDRTTIEGKWKQSGAVLALTLNRTATAIEVKRPQEPKPPYPYRAEEVSYENRTEGVKLAGTLTLPQAGGPFPAALLITGSGQQDRNEEIAGHKPFLVIADYLTRRGIAVLRVDDRGVGGSTGGVSGATTADFATDVRAGIDFLKNRRDINPNRIGLIGHSEGAIIAPMVAAQSNDAAFVVMLAGTGFTGDEVVESQLQLIEEADNVPSAKVKLDVELSRALHAMVKSGTDSASIDAKLREHLRAAISEWGEDLRKNGIDPETAIEKQTKALLQPWFRYFLAYDPIPALGKVRCPVLAMGGALHLQVPAGKNLEAIEHALKNGVNRDCTIKLLPGLNHIFQHAKTGSPREYAQSEETFAPEALTAMGDWIEEHVKK